MLTDNEISKAEQDLLNFSALSETLKDIIKNSDTPITIGLYGEWGSGKTSLMRMTQELLKKEDMIKEGTIKTAWFDAWKFDKSHDLRVALIQSILRQIEEDEDTKASFKEKVVKLRRDVNWLGLGMNVLSQFLPKPLTFQESTDPLIRRPEDIQKTLELIGDFEDEFTKIVRIYVNNNGNAENEVYNKGNTGTEVNNYKNPIAVIKKYLGIKENADNGIDTNGENADIDNNVEGADKEIDNDGKLVVFIDDLDRCIPEKTIDILETIKLFLNTPHSVFVIGADKKVIESGIYRKYKDTSKEWSIHYLDKIIQIPFFLPPLTKKIILDDFIPNLEIPAEIYNYKDIIAEVGINPRTIKRLINQFELQNTLADKQGMNLDLLKEIMAKLNVIQFRQPEFHDALVKMNIEDNINLVRIMGKLERANQAEEEYKEEWKLFGKYFDDKSFIKLLLKKEPYLESINLKPYFHLVQSTSDFKESKIESEAPIFEESAEYEAVKSKNEYSADIFDDRDEA